VNILFLTLSAGEGHNQVAKTLSQSILSIDNDTKIKIIDIFNYINPKLHKVLMEGYIKSIKYLPEIYSFFYRKTEEGESSLHEISELLNKTFVSRKIMKLIKDFQPNVIICTHPIPAEPISILKKKEKINIPVVITITDYTLHSTWLNKNLDYYIIPSDIFKYELEYWNIPLDKCKFYGIPVRSSFLENLNRNDICNELNLENKFTTLIMGGGLGLGNIMDTLDYIKTFDLDIQILVVTGQNKDLYEDLNSKYFTHGNIRIYRYFSEIHKLMTVSDVIITKPGGLTITEAIVKEVPLILTCSLPGQEERNTEFILNNGIGMIATSPNSLLTCIKTLENDKAKYNLIKQNMSKLKKPNALLDITKFILSFNEKRYKSLFI